MGLGNNESNVKFLGISYGKVRCKCDPETEGAIERELKDKTKTYALEWGYIEGYLNKVVYKTDGKYGNVWRLYITDNDQTYIIDMNENSRWAPIFLEILPNIRQGQWIHLSPYDYRKDDKRKVGMSISDINKDRIPSHYKNFSKGDDGKWTVELLNGYPDYTGPKDDKDELNIYFIKVGKFLREKSLPYIEANFQLSDFVPENIQAKQTESEDIPDIQPDYKGAPVEDDLPF